MSVVSELRMLSRMARLVASRPTNIATMKRNIAVSSVLPTLVACFHAPTSVVVQGFQNLPLSSHISVGRLLNIQATRTITTEEEDVDDESDWYAPPDFTVEDEHLFEEDKAPKYMPPDFTIEDEDVAVPEPAGVIQEESTPTSRGVAENEVARTTEVSTKAKAMTIPTRRKKKKPVSESMQATSWMEKNTKFATPPEPERPKKKDKEQKPQRGERRSGHSRTFRQDFRGARVFVQGLAPQTSWQSLKDHFRLAGEVVFASVSVDPRTGESKGCGVVQFETTEQAQNAIAIMRNHPLEGATLYVREDVQEKEGATLRNRAPRGDKQATIPLSWSCADESTAEMLDEAETTAIYSLIRARDEARRRRNYDASDDMREELKFKFGVHLDDRLKMWWVSADGRRVPQSISDMKGEGRWGAQKEWRQIPTTPENDACVNPDLVNGLLKQRDIARREKDFSTADALLEQARTAPDGDLNLRIHDESRTWRIWTEKPPPRQLMHGNKGTRLSPAEQCIQIVSEHAPEKLPEIETMLQRFPGREYNILKKLKQRYLKP